MKNDSISSDDDEFFLKPKKNISSSKTIPKTNKNMLDSYSERQIDPIKFNENKTLRKSEINKIDIKTKDEINIKKEETENKKEENKNEEKNKYYSNKYLNYNDIMTYLKIDKKNYFSVMNNKDYNYLKDIIALFQEKKGNRIDSINEIIKKFLENIVPNCDADPILISKYLSKEICKKRKLTKFKIEEYINYFFSFRYELLYSTKFCLNLKTLKILGYILSYMFSKYQINNGNEFMFLINKTIEKRIDVLMDYYKYINDNNIKEIDDKNKKTVYWKKNRNKYLIPPELNFLINRFIKINTIEIELDFGGENIGEEEFKLISIFFLNIIYIFVNLAHMKINFMNQKLLYGIYTGYFRDLLDEAGINNNIIKKNKIKNPELLYEKKWNFQNNFNLEEYRKIEKNKNKEEFNKINLIYDDYNLIYFNNTKRQINEEQMLNSTIEKKHTQTEIKNNSKINNNSDNTNKNIIKKEDNSLNNNNIEKNINDNAIKNKNNYIDTITNNSNFLDLIAIIICSIGRLTKINVIDIIMNDSYNDEIITHLVNTHDIDEELIDNNFHILDFIYNKIRDIKKINLEINALDNLTFSKVLNFIHKNEKLKALQLSFFSSDIIYYRISLIKLYNQITGNAEKLIKSKNINIERKILNDLLPFFIENLSVLFELLKKNKNMEILGFNFDLPNIIINEQNYILPILKFIINILFFVNNNRCKIQKLTILSPSIAIDNKLLTGVNDIFCDININNNNKILNELNIQIQFYQMEYIKNLISDRLIKLNIGDLDIITFKHLVKYLISYKFCSKSILENIGIGLNKTITNFNTELRISFRELFYIKLSNLLELKLYTNIIINNEKEYCYLIDILKDNWISSYIITFNSKSDKILTKCKNLKNNIPFFVSPKLINKIHNDKEKNNKSTNINDNNYYIYWCLKYLFDYKYFNSSSNFFSKKICINTILKYLYLEKNIKIKHNLEEDEIINNEIDDKK